MTTHPPLEDILAPHSPAVAQHLNHCARCRIEARLARIAEIAPLTTELPSNEPSEEAERPEPQRYTPIKLIGSGGMGEVWRVHDKILERKVAMKQLRADRKHDLRATKRFLQEARVVAGLQHPGIIPVYDAGILADGRRYFTMKEIHGITFGEVIRRLHREGSDTEWPNPREPWTLRRTIEIFHRVCEATGHAHHKGVYHRDLKPANVMVGDAGEVQVLDWGLVKSTTPTNETSNDPTQTLTGTVAGTPPYMSPEQASGQPVDARTDVYALGALLGQILYNRVPFEGLSTKEILRQLQQRVVPVLHPKHGRSIPPELESLRRRAMSEEPDARPRDARVIAGEIREWLDGIVAREQAIAIYQNVISLAPEFHARRAEAGRRRKAAESKLAQIPPWADSESKEHLWAELSAVDALQHEADTHWLESTQRLHMALNYWSGLLDARRELARRYRQELQDAEYQSDASGIMRAEIALREQISALPEQDPIRQELTVWLKGTGALTLLTNPPGASVTAHRYILDHRRLKPGPAVPLGETPLDRTPLEIGSYLIIIEHPECDPVRYPVQIGRGEYWDGIPPGAESPHAIPLPRKGRLGPDEVYIPAGWVSSGGDPEAIHPVERRQVWVDGFIMARTPVTNRLYIENLDSIVQTEGLDVAMKLVPCEDTNIKGTPGVPIYGQVNERFVLIPDRDGDLWEPDWPVLMLDYRSASLWTEFYAERTGRKWRLPGSFEWEKAGRGVDGRSYVWGEYLDPSWCQMRLSNRGEFLAVSVDTLPLDRSPYGVRHMNGNCREWTRDIFVEGGELPNGHHASSLHSPPTGNDERRILRGGSWIAGFRGCRLASRDWAHETWRNGDQGFRLARELDAKDFA